MPGISDPIFQSKNDQNFEAGVPLLFFVRMRVREEGGGNVVTEGKWEEVFTPVEDDQGNGVEIVETSWMCQDSSVGYSVSDYFFYLVYFISSKEKKKLTKILFFEKRFKFSQMKDRSPLLSFCLCGARSVVFFSFFFFLFLFLFIFFCRTKKILEN